LHKYIELMFYENTSSTFCDF